VNPTYRQDHQSGVQENRSYAVRAPDAVEKQRWRQMVAFQFLSPGAPYIYYGDEVGMWGADDPDCRKPMLWPDLRYDRERSHPFGMKRLADGVAPDAGLRRFYQGLARLRARLEVLRTGGFEVVLSDDERRLIAFRRKAAEGGASVTAIFNASDRRAKVGPGDLKLGSFRGWKHLWPDEASISGGLDIPPRGSVVLGCDTP
jgi:cyclomaltodextrinase